MAPRASRGPGRIHPVSFTSHAATEQAARNPADADQELAAVSGQAGLAMDQTWPGRVQPVIQAVHPWQDRGGRNLFPAEDGEGTRRVFSGYPGVPREIGKARRDGTPVLQECPAAANVILCLSEIATNAVTHSRSGVPGGHFTVVVDLCCGEYVKVSVIDDGGSWAEGVHGGDIAYRHGLTIVQDLSAGMGIEGDDAGRAVWFVCGWTAS